MKTIYNKSKIFRNAWVIFRKIKNISTSLIQSWRNEKIELSKIKLELLSKQRDNMVNFIREKMKNGFVNFDFIKKDGTVRNSNGTLLNSIIKDYLPSFDENYIIDQTLTYTRYFDLDCGGWRTFTNESLIQIN